MEEVIFSDGYGPFPDVEKADEEGLLAIGGSLYTDRLINAYENGIFPWFSEGDPIMWFAPAERFVLFVSELKVSKSMQQLRNHNYTIKENNDFDTVIKNCSAIKRKGQDGTWIIDEMIMAYQKLFEMGRVKCVEVWEGKEMVGGLYGVEMGRLFCGESMFSKKSNTSKLAFIHLCQSGRYDMIDCQIYTPHLANMGARLIERKHFTELISKLH